MLRIGIDVGGTFTDVVLLDDATGEVWSTKVPSTPRDPSVGALKRVLDGLPMSLAEFFALDLPAPRKAFYKADELAEVGKGKISYRQVGADLSGRALQILVERYAPGADTGRVLLRHEGEEGGVVLKGRLEVTVAGQTRVLGPGDAYYFESQQPHRFRSLGPEPCELISACTPRMMELLCIVYSSPHAFGRVTPFWPWYLPPRSR